MTTTPLTDRIAELTDTAPATPLSPIPGTIPVRPCEPWCIDGDGHPDNMPGDRTCTSVGREVPLTLADPINWGKGGGEWIYATQAVSLRRFRDAAEVVVVLYNVGKESETDMTLDEAEQYARNIRAEVASARGL